MRALRVVGLDEDGETVICEDPENGERFSVPADERLRAAARGDLTRLGQAQIEMEAQMRPREIQARIRSGATVAQVASSAGLPEQRVERYAYPVLLERAQIAERAQRAHPVRDEGPDIQTLGEVTTTTFAMRGLDLQDAWWDAWRGEDGKWVVQLRWLAGRSENRAHWVLHGTHGGTVTALDEHAADLLDPSPNRPLRTVRPVTELAREALELDQTGTEGATPGLDAPFTKVGAVQSEHARDGVRDSALQDSAMKDRAASDKAVSEHAVADKSAQNSVMDDELLSDDIAESAGLVETKDDTELAEATAESAEVSTAKSEEAETTEQVDSGVGDSGEDGARAEIPEIPEVGEVSRSSAVAEVAAIKPDGDSEKSSSKKNRKNHPIVPSWEDVLLGVRSHR